MNGIPPEILEYYNRGDEAERLLGGSPHGPLEQVRTQELILRHLPEGPLDILDVGGGPGIYAGWLAGLGHRVHVIDPVPLHVQQADEIDGVTAEVGEARALTQDDASVDVVLLMGPLYHLTEREQRDQALAEAYRVLRPGGQLVASSIGRYSALLNLLINEDWLHEPRVLPIVEEGIATGRFEGDAEDLFTISYMHLPGELEEEVVAARFEGVAVFGVEGPGGLVPDIAERWTDDGKRETILRAAQMVEQDRNLLPASTHLLATGRKPA